MIFENKILFEDNHILLYNKEPGLLIQRDKANNPSLEDFLKDYIRQKTNKVGNIFLGVVHRIDRPVSGVVLFAKTSKALKRLNQMQQERKIKKIYWAISANIPEQRKGKLEHYIIRNELLNKSYVTFTKSSNAKLASLNYEIIAKSDRYFLWQIELETGRHHQIRCQLAYIHCPIKGDLKYGFQRPNTDKSISLHARKIIFEHPVSKDNIIIEAPVPDDKLWKYFEISIMP